MKLCFLVLSLLVINNLLGQDLLPKEELFQQKKYISLAEATQQKDSVYRLSLSSMRNLHDRIAEGKTGAGVHIESIPYQLFPSQILMFSKLQILRIHYHKLTEIPSSIGQLKNLQALDLGNNRLKDLPQSLEKLNYLQILSLPNNAFSEIPEVIYRLPHLRVLDFSNNPISEELKAELRQKLPRKVQIIF